MSIPGVTITHFTPYDAEVMTHFFFSTNDASGVFGVIVNAFQKIGINPIATGDNTFLKPGEWGVFIPQKF